MSRFDSENGAQNARFSDKGRTDCRRRHRFEGVQGTGLGAVDLKSRLPVPIQRSVAGTNQMLPHESVLRSL